MSTKIEIRKAMFDYEKMSEMIVSELDFAVSDDTIPEERWEEHIKYLIERGLHEYIKRSIEIHHSNNVDVYMNKSDNTFSVSCDGSEIYDILPYNFYEQTGAIEPEIEGVYIDNEKYITKNLSVGAILGKIKLGIEENIENEYHNPKKLEKIMKVFYKVCGDYDQNLSLRYDILEMLDMNIRIGW